MSRTVSRTGVLAVLVALTAALLTLLPTTADAATTGRVRGYVAGDAPTTVTWFTTDWQYLGSRSVPASSVYALSLAPGTYRLQFTDRRPSWDIKRYAPTDETVVVRAGHTAIRNVRMHRGAAITGRVKVNGEPGRKATVTAANAAEQSFTTTANERGEFAIGGLPRGSYSIFTYDRQRQYVAKSTYVAGLKPGHSKDVRLRLSKRAGSLVVDLYAGAEPIDRTVVVTAVSRKTGQFWTVKARHGTAVFRGVYPGRYRLHAPGYGDYLARTGAVSRGQVRAGRPAFGSFRLVQRGGAFTGRVLAGDNGEPLGKVTVRVYDAGGAIVAATTTATDGTFRVGGRLGTQRGLTVVAYDSDLSDVFETLRVPDLSVAVGNTEDLGDLSLPAKPTTTLTGKVVDAYNIAVPLGGSTVQVYGDQNRLIGEATSTADGSFSVPRLPPQSTYVTLVVTPTVTSVAVDGTSYACRYARTSYGGIGLYDRGPIALGNFGATRVAGQCVAPTGDHFKR